MCKGEDGTLGAAGIVGEGFAVTVVEKRGEAIHLEPVGELQCGARLWAAELRTTKSKLGSSQRPRTHLPVARGVYLSYRHILLSDELCGNFIEDRIQLLAVTAPGCVEIQEPKIHSARGLGETFEQQTRCEGGDICRR